MAPGRNTIERAVNEILSQIGDGSKYVEYWTRQQWRSIEAHADVDEFLAKHQDAAGNTNSSDFRYPTYGHVLYLKIGSEVRAPTCVFRGRRSGKDLLSSDLDGIMKSDVELVTVPAVNGRLLRFSGDALHSVPRPADLWLLKFVQGAAKYDPEEDWGRSVILFNTWGSPPMDVPINSENDDEELTRGAAGSCNEKSEWVDTYGLDQNLNNETCYDQSQTDSRLAAKIWLLGNLRRRGHHMRTLKLSAPSNLKEALHEDTKVTRLFLSQVDL